MYAIYIYIYAICMLYIYISIYVCVYVCMLCMQIWLICGVDTDMIILCFLSGV